MVTVENVRAGAYYNRATGHTNVGDRVDVSESVAAYLCDTRGDFARVESGECEVVKSDGDVCGRERPCSYHD